LTDEFLSDAKEKVQKSGYNKNKAEAKEKSKYDADIEEFDHYHQYSIYNHYGFGGRGWEC